MAKTRYYVTLTIWDQDGDTVFAESFFETGLLNSSQTAWNEAVWIGAPVQELDAATKSCFRVQTTFEIPKGSSQAGLVFANDFRLLDSTKNIFQLSGEHYIAYTIVLDTTEAWLHCYRVGYANGDNPAVPFYRVNITSILPPEQWHIPHELAVEVYTNVATAYLNGVLREFYPKKIDLALVDQKELTRNLFLINNRPRKCLNWKSPIQAPASAIALSIVVLNLRACLVSS